MTQVPWPQKESQGDDSASKILAGRGWGGRDGCPDQLCTPHPTPHPFRPCKSSAWAAFPLLNGRENPGQGHLRDVACSRMALTPDSRTSEPLFCFIATYWGDWGAARISKDSFSGTRCLSSLSCLIRTCNAELIPVRLEDGAPHVGASRAVRC